MRNSYLSSSFNSVVSLDMDSSWAAKSWDLSNIYFNQNGNQVGFNKSITKDPLLSEQDNLLTKSFNRGKVRQLFLERRGKGWDRSYPLEPIKSKHKPNKTRGHSPLTKSLSNIPDYYTSYNPSEKIEQFNFPTRLPNIGGAMQQQRENSSSMRRVSKIPQPKSTVKASLPDEMRKLTISPRKSVVQSSEKNLKPKLEVKSFGTSTQKNEIRARNTNKVPANGRSTPMESTSSHSSPQSSASLRPKPSSQVTPTPQKVAANLDPDKAQCPICGRSFLKDRIQVHESICKKSKTKKRKTFDPVKQRLAGTEAEPYLKKGSSHVKAAPKNVDTKPKSDWRKKHEDFIASIRAAKQVKEHLAKGGKLSDLPPPPPMDTSDYVQCQHCKRKFNAAVAERHIPICSKVKSNKPTTKRSVKK